jgi:hypothetical protein
LTIRIEGAIVSRRNLVVAIIDPISGFVTMVDTVLTRIDAREDRLKERLDIRDALLDLLHLVREWARAAKATNEVFAAWASGTQPELEADVKGRIGRTDRPVPSWDEATLKQGVIAKAVSRKLGAPTVGGEETTEKRPRATASDLIFTYAPELEAFFEETLEERLKLVEGARGSLESPRPGFFLRSALALVYPTREIPPMRDPAAESSQLAALEHSRENLDELARRLAAFIAANFGLEGSGVRP